MTVSENISQIRERVRAAAREAGTDPEGLFLVAATKARSFEEIREAVSAGVHACGENRVQELLKNFKQNAYASCPVHFIGHLQSNKAKQLVGRVELIQSVDSIKLLELINSLASSLSIKQDILLQLNIAGEVTKSGFAPEELDKYLDCAAGLSSIRVRGLMAVPPICDKAVNNRPYFERIRQLFVDKRGKKYDNVSIDILSVGMSGDYEEAVRCGSNMIRLGSAIFGPRNYGGIIHN